MLRVVESACTGDAGTGRMVVVVESDQGGPPFEGAFSELGGAEATNMAIAFAAGRGISPAYLNGNKIGPYAVNAEGLPLEEVRDKSGAALPQTHPRMQPALYRVDVPISRGIR